MALRASHATDKHGRSHRMTCDDAELGMGPCACCRGVVHGGPAMPCDVGLLPRCTAVRRWALANHHHAKGPNGQLGGVTWYTCPHPTCVRICVCALHAHASARARLCTCVHARLRVRACVRLSLCVLVPSSKHTVSLSPWGYYDPPAEHRVWLRWPACCQFIPSSLARHLGSEAAC